MRLYPLLLIAATGIIGAAAPARAAGSAATLYTDKDARSVANVSEVLPDKKIQTEIFEHVTSIDLIDGTYVIHFASHAVALLTRDYVIDITINQHSLAPATVPR